MTLGITTLPTPPTRSDPTNFAARGDALMVSLPQFVDEVNALGAAMGLVGPTPGPGAFSNLLVGAATDVTNLGASVVVYHAVNPALCFRNSTSGQGNSVGADIFTGSTSLEFNNRENGPINLSTAGTGRVRIEGAGDVLIGKTTNASGYRLQVRAAGGSSLLLEDSGGNSQFLVSNANIATGYNAAASVFYCNKDATTGRSGSVAGTIGLSGADYADYVRKAASCVASIAKGDIVGFDINGKLTNRWSEVVSGCGVKTTDPNLVGGDRWGSAEAIGMDVPVEPRPPEAEPQEPGILYLPERPQQEGRSAQRYEFVLGQWEAQCAAMRDAHEAAVAAYPTKHAEWTAQQEAYVAALAQFETDKAEFAAKYEEARQQVDRIAKAGTCPVNVQGAAVGDWIVPVKRDDGGIGGIAVADADIDFAQYKKAVGLVRRILDDGRAEIEVKAAASK